MSFEGETVEGFQLSKLIGKGISGEVYLAIDTNTDHPVALKRFFPNSSKAFSKELSAYIRISRNQNTLNMYSSGESVKTDSERVFGDYVVLELAARGPLYDYIEKLNPLPVPIVRTLSLQLLSGLRSIHGSGFAHRDLKLDNLFLDQEFTLKIGDMGFAEPNGLFSNTIGTKSYMAPEVHQRIEYDAQTTDIFSSGVIIFILNVGCPAFNMATTFDRFYSLLAARAYERFWRIFTHAPGANNIDSNFKDLIQNMLDIDPYNRPSVEEVLRHPWMTGETASQEDLNECLSKSFIESLM